MSAEELEEQIKKAETQGFPYVPLTMPDPASWVKRGFGGERVRTPFGLCKYYPGRTGLLIYPTVKQAKRLLKKLLESK